MTRETWEAAFAVLHTEELLGIAAFGFAATFAWSGFVKLRRPALAALAIRNFGLSAHVNVRHGRLAGVLELTLAAWLATRLVPAVAAFGAAALLWIFSGLITRSLIRGERFACFCFGDTETAISGATLLRTLSLAVAASFVAASASVTTPAFDSSVVPLEAIAGVAAVAIAALVVNAYGALRPKAPTVELNDAA